MSFRIYFHNVFLDEEDEGPLHVDFKDSFNGYGWSGEVPAKPERAATSLFDTVKRMLAPASEQIGSLLFPRLHHSYNPQCLTTATVHDPVPTTNRLLPREEMI